MSDDDADTCGYIKDNGEPCQLPASRPDGRCHHHTEIDDQRANGGRDSKLTKEREEQIAQAIEQGKSINSASRMVGVTPQTVYNWLDRGEQQEEGLYADFFERITRAKGVGEDKYFSTIWELAKEQGDHRFLASLMKQRYPDAWDDTETGVDAADITVTSDVVEIDESSVTQ